MHEPRISQLNTEWNEFLQEKGAALFRVIYLPDKDADKYNYFLKKLGLSEYSLKVDTIVDLIDEIKSLNTDENMENFIQRLQLVDASLMLTNQCCSLTNRISVSVALSLYSNKFNRWLRSRKEKNESKIQPCIKEIEETLTNAANDLSVIDSRYEITSIPTLAAQLCNTVSVINDWK